MKQYRVQRKRQERTNRGLDMVGYHESSKKGYAYTKTRADVKIVQLENGAIRINPLSGLKGDAGRVRRKRVDKTNHPLWAWK